jgi:hypothetical protein
MILWCQKIQTKNLRVHLHMLRAHKVVPWKIASLVACVTKIKFGAKIRLFRHLFVFFTHTTKNVGFSRNFMYSHRLEMFSNFFNRIFDNLKCLFLVKGAYAREWYWLPAFLSLYKKNAWVDGCRRERVYCMLRFTMCRFLIETWWSGPNIIWIQQSYLGVKIMVNWWSYPA